MSKQLYALDFGKVVIYNITENRQADHYAEIFIEQSEVKTENTRFFFTKQELIDYVNKLPDLQ